MMELPVLLLRQILTQKYQTTPNLLLPTCRPCLLAPRFPPVALSLSLLLQMSSGVTTNGVASVSSTSSMPLRQSSVSESDQMGMRSTMPGSSSVGVGGAGGTGLTNPQSDPEKHKLIQ